MIRGIVGVSVALVLAGCETTLVGGGNVGGGGSDSSDSTSGVGTTGSAPTCVTVATSSSSGSPGECPSLDGVPVLEKLRDLDSLPIAFEVTDDDLLLGLEWDDSGFAQFLRLSKDGSMNLEQFPTEQPISTLYQDGETLYGSGFCIDGGMPYVIGPGPAIEPIAYDCSGHSGSIVPIAGGVAYATDNRGVAWAPLDGSGTSEDLLTMEEAGGDYTSHANHLATDGTDLFAAVGHQGIFGDSPFIDASWGEIWRIPMNGDTPQRIVAMEPVQRIGIAMVGGISGMVVDDDYVYFAEHGSGRVGRVPKGCGPVEILFDGDHHVGNLVEVGDDLAFTELTNPSTGAQGCTPILRMMPKAGGEAVPIAVIPAWTRSVVADGTTLFVTADEVIDNVGHPGVYRTPAVRP
jgi:hypothetical protein